MFVVESVASDVDYTGKRKLALLARRRDAGCSAKGLASHLAGEVLKPSLTASRSFDRE